MKKRFNKPILFIILAIAISVTLTILILLKHTKNTTIEDATDTQMSEVVDTMTGWERNVYVISIENNQIEYWYRKERKVCDANIQNSYTGVADLFFEKGILKKLCTKQDSISGIISRYTNDQIEIKDYGSLFCVDDLPVYDISKNQMEERDKKDLIVGISNVRFILENNIVQAILIEEDSVASTIRVLIKNEDSIFFPNIQIQSEQDYVIASAQALEERKGAQQLDVKSYMESKNVEQIRLSDSETGFCLVTPKNNDCKIVYPSTLYCVRCEEGYVLINELSIEEYVKRVLPSEMPTKFEMEALKAQAVCARTYAYSHLKNDAYAQYGANIDDSTAYQVYNAVETNDKSNNAVDETKDEVLFYDNQLISCYYYSTSAGVTETTDVWNESNDEALSPGYIYRACTLEESPGDLSVENNFDSFIRSQPLSYESDSPFYRWKAYMNLMMSDDEEYGKIKQISVTNRSESGYVLELQIICSKGTRKLNQENAIRRYLGNLLTYVELNDGSIRQNLTMVPSACFCISREEQGQIVLFGGGFGHGIGLSQYGAGKMAENQFTYKEILQFYYHDVTLEKMKDCIER